LTTTFLSLEESFLDVTITTGMARVRDPMEPLQYHSNEGKKKKRKKKKNSLLYAKRRGHHPPQGFGGGKGKGPRRTEKKGEKGRSHALGWKD